MCMRSWRYIFFDFFLHNSLIKCKVTAHAIIRQLIYMCEDTCNDVSYNLRHDVKCLYSCWTNYLWYSSEFFHTLEFHRNSSCFLFQLIGLKHSSLIFFIDWICEKILIIIIICWIICHYLIRIFKNICNQFFHSF